MLHAKGTNLQSLATILKPVSKEPRNHKRLRVTFKDEKPSIKIKNFSPKIQKKSEAMVKPLPASGNSCNKFVPNRTYTNVKFVPSGCIVSDVLSEEFEETDLDYVWLSYFDENLSQSLASVNSVFHDSARKKKVFRSSIKLECAPLPIEELAELPTCLTKNKLWRRGYGKGIVLNQNILGEALHGTESIYGKGCAFNSKRKNVSLSLKSDVQMVGRNSISDLKVKNNADLHHREFCIGDVLFADGIDPMHGRCASADQSTDFEHGKLYCANKKSTNHNYLDAKKYVKKEKDYYPEKFNEILKQSISAMSVSIKENSSFSETTESKTDEISEVFSKGNDLLFQISQEEVFSQNDQEKNILRELVTLQGKILEYVIKKDSRELNEKSCSGFIKTDDKEEEMEEMEPCSQLIIEENPNFYSNFDPRNLAIEKMARLERQPRAMNSSEFADMLKVSVSHEEEKSITNDSDFDSASKFDEYGIKSQCDLFAKTNYNRHSTALLCSSQISFL